MTAVGTQRRSGREEKPNIVFLFADQMRADATGYAGDPNVQTPCLDTLAGESLVFENAISNCPVCTPYRACLLTGQYPLTHGLFMNDLCLPDNGHSFAQALRREGYNTAYIGKWHLDGHGRTNYIPRERRHGFEYWKTLECTHDYHNSLYYDGDNPAAKTWPGYDAFAQSKDAADYIQNAAGSRPFALFLSFGPPHNPYDTAPEEYRMLYDPQELVLHENVAGHRERHARNQLQGYYAHITALDDCLATIDKALISNGLKDNTIFVFTSDHGDMVESHWQGSDYGVRKQRPYEESIRVPFLLRYPRKYGREPRSIPTPLAAPDIMPTLLGMSGNDIPGTVEGIDLTPIIAGETKPERKGVLIANYHPFADWRTARGGRPYRGIRTERYTFTRDRNGPWMLFDNQEDPYQLDNLVDRSACIKIQTGLDTELAGILHEQDDAFDRPETLRKKWHYRVDDSGAIPY